MASDASIYGLIREQKPLAGPVDQFGQLLNLKALMTQNRVHELQAQDTEQTLGEKNAFRQGLASLAPGETYESAIPRLMSVAPMQTMELQQRLLTQKKLTGDIGKQELDIQAAKAKDARDTLAGVKDQPSWDAWKQYATDKGYQVAASAPAVFDPNWQQQHLMTAEQFITNVEHQKNRALTAAGQSETARHNKVQEFYAGLTQKETARHHAALEGDPAVVEETAKAIANGQLAPLSGFALARPMAQNIMARVVQINPDFDPTQFATRQKAEKDFATGKQGQSVKSFNVAISHLGTLEPLVDALNNNDTKLINQIANAYKTQTGASTAPTNFEAAKQIVGDEIVKAIVGAGGGVADREKAQAQLDKANSPALLKGVIATYKDLMKGQLDGLRTQYEASTGKKDFDKKFLSEDARAVAHGNPAAAPKSATPKGGKLTQPVKFLGFE